MQRKTGFQSSLSLPKKKKKKKRRRRRRRKRRRRRSRKVSRWIFYFSYWIFFLGVSEKKKCLSLQHKMIFCGIVTYLMYNNYYKSMSNNLVNLFTDIKTICFLILLWLLYAHVFNTQLQYLLSHWPTFR